MLAATNTNKPRSSPTDLEQTFRAHHERVFGAAYRVTGSAQDAEDVLQTVFLRLLRRGPSLDLAPSPASYLHRAAVNASLDLLRARSRAGTLPLDDFEPFLEDAPQLAPDRRQEGQELRRDLRRAILELGNKQAQIFCLRFLEGVGNREIAGMLDMTQTAVGVALHRARNQVKKAIALR